MPRLSRTHISILLLLTLASLSGCVTRPKPLPEIAMTNSMTSPDVVSPGDIVNIVSGYSLKLPYRGDTAEVRDFWVLKKNGQVVITSDPHIERHPSGNYTITAAIPIPAGAESGTYVVETKVKAEPSFDMRQVTFVVQSAKQKASGSGKGKKSRGSRHRKK